MSNFYRISLLSLFKMQSSPKAARVITDKDYLKLVFFRGSNINFIAITYLHNDQQCRKLWNCKQKRLFHLRGSFKLSLCDLYTHWKFAIECECLKKNWLPLPAIVAKPAIKSRKSRKKQTLDKGFLKNHQTLVRYCLSATAQLVFLRPVENTISIFPQ